MTKKIDYVDADASTTQLAKKINEIVDWVNDQEPTALDDNPNKSDRCEKHGLLFCDKCQEKYPDFNRWKDDAIETNVWLGFEKNDGKDEFLTVAPEDFYIEKDGDKQYFFTWDEAMEFEKEVLKPNGWRLPTCKELVQLCATYIDEKGDDDVNRFMKELKVKMRGYKTPNGNIANVGSDGYWWSSTANSSASARDLVFLSGYFLPQNSYGKGFGFAIRPVRINE